MRKNISQAAWGIFLGLLTVGGMALWFYGAGELSLWVGSDAALGHTIFGIIFGGILTWGGHDIATSNKPLALGVSFGAIIAATILLLVIIDGTAATKVAGVWIAPAILGWTLGSFLAK